MACLPGIAATEHMQGYNTTLLRLCTIATGVLNGLFFYFRILAQSNNAGVLFMGERLII